MNKHKRYCFEAEGKKFKKIIAHNGSQLVEVAAKTKLHIYKQMLLAAIFTRCCYRL